MKRAIELRPLSREHHHALVLARRVEREAARADADLVALWRDACHALETSLDPHFVIEERHLLTPLAARGERALVERTRSDHDRLRALMTNGPVGEPLRDRLRAFAALLPEHVRFEEAVLFPLAEARLSPTQLAEVLAAHA